MKKIAWGLVIIGALNWGLVGAGNLISGANWNIVDLIFSQTLANIIYVLVGVSAIWIAIRKCACRGCCKACKNGTCAIHKSSN